MYAKLIVFALLGTTVVLASPLDLEPSINERGVSDYLSLDKWWQTVKNHYHNIENIATDFGNEIKSQFQDAFNLSKETVDKLRNDATKASQAAREKYEAEKAKWEARVKDAMDKGKEAAQKAQAQAIEAINKAYEALKNRYQEIRDKLRKDIKEAENNAAEVTTAEAIKGQE